MKVALTIAGSDPSGGAGIQADLKTFHQLGVYGEAVITLITVQNTLRLSRVEILDADLVRQQIEAVIADIPPAAAKTGALGNRAVVEAVASAAATFTFPLVVDPVMISKQGAQLADDSALNVLRESLLPRAFLLMPNLAEAEALTGLAVRAVAEMERAARTLVKMGARNVLVKGGHLDGDAVDVLVLEDGNYRIYAAPRNRNPTYARHGMHLFGSSDGGARSGIAAAGGCGSREEICDGGDTDEPGFGRWVGSL